MGKKSNHSWLKKLNTLDIGILNELYQDSTQSNKQIARKLKSNQPKINRRINRLLKEGYIKKFTIQPDFWKLGKRTLAIIYVKISVKELNKLNLTLEDIATNLKKHSYVFHSLVISGDWDILLIVRTKDNDELNSLIDNFIRKEKCIINTLTFFTFKEIEGYDNPFD